MRVVVPRGGGEQTTLTSDVSTLRLFEPSARLSLLKGTDETRLLTPVSCLTHL